MITQEEQEIISKANTDYSDGEYGEVACFMRSSFYAGALWIQSKQSAEISRLRSALLEIANMRGSVASDIAIKALNP